MQLWESPGLGRAARFDFSLRLLEKKGVLQIEVSIGGQNRSFVAVWFCQ